MIFLLPLALAALVAQQPETLSLLKEPLYPPPLPRAERARLEQEIAQARGALGREPANVDVVLRLARAQRALGHVGDAMETLTRAMENKADAPAIRLERGRDFVLIRKFELAEREFKKAVEAVPEARCDLAFTLYLLGDYKQSHAEYGGCAQPGVFGYLAARRAGVDAGARPATPDDSAAAAPIRLPGSVSAGPAKPDASLAGGYMDAVDRLVADDKAAARERLKGLLEKHADRWMEAVYVAAEADYARIAPKGKHDRKKKKARRI